MAEPDIRNAEGYPLQYGPSTRPQVTVRSGGAPLTSNVDQSVDASTNKPLPWVALGCALGGIGFAMGLAALLVVLIGGPAYVQARVAQSHAELENRFIKLEQGVQRAQQDSAIAKDWTDQRNAELKVLRSANGR